MYSVVSGYSWRYFEEPDRGTSSTQRDSSQAQRVHAGGERRFPLAVEPVSVVGVFYSWISSLQKQFFSMSGLIRFASDWTIWFDYGFIWLWIILSVSLPLSLPRILKSINECCIRFRVLLRCSPEGRKRCFIIHLWSCTFLDGRSAAPHTAHVQSDLWETSHWLTGQPITTPPVMVTTGSLFLSCFLGFSSDDLIKTKSEICSF